ncbi:MAG TPA: hypothetical protein GX708_24620 [Gallicola sp.]|nr:hypothetical protein [Gallicola sp.]
MKTLEKIGVVSLVGGVLTLLIFSPVLTFGFAYLGGLILKWIIGDAVCNGLNIVFNTTRFNPNLIPIVCATLATIGQYFKSTQINNK